MAGFALVLVQFARLQWVEHEMWALESRRSARSVVSLPFERGWILDRNGQPLALTERVDDLSFSPREWRRGSVAGLVSGACWTLGAPWRSPSAVRAAVELDLPALGGLSVGEILDLRPAGRREDLVSFYLARLFGTPFRDALRAALREHDPARQRRLAGLPGFATGLAAARLRAQAEADAWSRLSALVRPVQGDLGGAVDEVASRAATLVARELALPADLRTAALDTREAWRALQELQAEFESQPGDVAVGLDYDAVTLLLLRATDLPGLGLVSRSRRIYPPAVADLAPALVGRVGAPTEADVGPGLLHRSRLAWLSGLDDLTPEELDEFEELRVAVRELDYGPEEERGRLGLEASFEAQLRGTRGWVATWLDSAGEERSERQEPRRGLDVTLTLDSSLQAACEDVLDAVFRKAPPVEGAPADAPPRWAGAIVLLDPRKGDVLALASSPRPRRAELAADYGRLAADRWRPLNDRAIFAGASGNPPPPGSTFKPVSALAGLGAGAADGSTLFTCDGGLGEGKWRMGCLGQHGETDLQRALAVSCNVYFYRLGQATGAERLAEMARAFGFATHAPLVRGNARLLAAGLEPRWGFSEASLSLGAPPWSERDAMRLAIGQAPLDDVTPLQVAVMLGAVGTGRRVTPRLVAAVEGVPLTDEAPIDLGLPPEHLELVRGGLAQVLDPAARGTADELTRRHPALAAHIAGKTGTAEVSGLPDQSWFAGYLPREAPALCFAVLIEDCGLHGAEAALPVFMELLDRPEIVGFLEREVLPGAAGGRGTR